MKPVTKRLCQLLFAAANLADLDLRRKAIALQRAIPLIAQALVIVPNLRIRVRAKAIGGCTDGKTLWLMDGVIPSTANDVDAFTRFVSLKLGLMHHEVGHVNESDFTLDRSKETPLVQTTYAIVEDVRMENAHIRRYKAARKPLDALGVAAIDIGLHADTTDADGVSTLYEAFLLYGLRCHVRSQVDYADLAEAARTRLASKIGEFVVGQMEALHFPEVSTLRSSAEALDLARDIAFLLEEELNRQQQQQQSITHNDQNQQEQQAGQGQDGGEADGGADQQQIDAIAELLALDHADIPEDFDGQLRQQLDATATQMLMGGQVDTPDLESIEAGLSPGSEPAYTGGDTDLSTAESAIARLSNQLRINLQSLTISRRVPTVDGTRVSPKHLYRTALGDGRIFLRKPSNVGRGIDAAVFIAGDLSGSMDTAHNGVKPVHLCNQAMYATAVALQRIRGVDVSVGLFPGRQMALRFGQRAVQHSNHFNLKADGSSTPLDEGVTMGIAALSTSRRQKKVLMVVTDGQPDDPVLAQAAIEHALLLDIEVFAIGILLPDVAEIFPKYCVISDVRELPTAMMSMLGSSLFQPMAVVS